MAIHSFQRTELFSFREYVKCAMSLSDGSTTRCTCACRDVDSSRCDIDPAVTLGFVSKVNITISGYWKVITSNGIPNHTIGKFPLGNSAHPQEYCCCGRPTAMKEQNYTFVMPAYSSKGVFWPGTVFEIPKPPYEDMPEGAFGVAVNGVPFDPVADEWWHRPNHLWNQDPLRHPDMVNDLDCNNGHVQPDGGYHYHGFPYGLFNKIKSEQEADVLTQGRSNIVLLGWAFDGNPIYGEHCGISNSDLVNAKSSYQKRTSTSTPPARTNAADPTVSEFPLLSFVEDYWFNNSLYDGNKSVQLDECNGHTGYTPEFTHGVYHYHILEKTESSTDIGFPYIGRCWRLFTYGQGPNIFPKPK
jgi:hypothetical protein